MDAWFIPIACIMWMAALFFALAILRGNGDYD